MRAVVDAELCIGCEACVDTCPEVFEMDGDTAVVTVDDVSDDLAEACREAAQVCPVDAISIED